MFPSKYAPLFNFSSHIALKTERSVVQLVEGMLARCCSAVYSALLMRFLCIIALCLLFPVCRGVLRQHCTVLLLVHEYRLMNG